MRPTREEIERRLGRIRDALAGYEAERIVVFGSTARGDWHEASDIDLIIVRNTTQPFFERLSEVARLLPADLAIEALVYTPEEVARMLARGNGLLARAFREGHDL